MNGELLKRISLLPRRLAPSVGDSVFSEEQRNLIAEAYQSLLGKQIPNCSCRNRYTDALIEICATFKIKTNMSNCKYQLFAGVIIWIGTDCYSNHNLTDEIAEKYLAMHPEAREKEIFPGMRSKRIPYRPSSVTTYSPGLGVGMPISYTLRANNISSKGCRTFPG